MLTVICMLSVDLNCRFKCFMKLQIYLFLGLKGSYDDVMSAS